jgi:hypothetical protein
VSGKLCLAIIVIVYDTSACLLYIIGCAPDLVSSKLCLAIVVIVYDTFADVIVGRTGPGERQAVSCYCCDCVRFVCLL